MINGAGEGNRTLVIITNPVLSGNQLDHRHWAAPAYTLRFDSPTGTPRQITLKLEEQEQAQDHEQERKVALKEARALPDLKPETWIRVKDAVTTCFDLPKGKSVLEMQT